MWETKCGKTGNCWLYDNDKFRNYLHSAAIVFILIGSLFDALMIFFADRVKNIAQDDQEEENQENQVELRQIDDKPQTEV